MKKSIYLIPFLFLLVFSSCNSGSVTGDALSKVKKELSSDFNSMNSALLNRDYESYMNFLNPTIIERTGGRRKMTILLEDSEIIMSENDVKITEVVIDSILSVTHNKGRTHVLFNQITRLNKTGQIEAKRYKVIGVSKNNSSWQFTDITESTNEEIKFLIPTFEYPQN